VVYLHEEPRVVFAAERKPSRMNDAVRPLLRPNIARLTDGQGVESDIRSTANEIHNRALALRTAARQDATIVVARARERGGASPTSWSAFDADAVHLITDLLLKLQGQEPAALDPSFRTRDDALLIAATATGRIEEAMKRDGRGEQALEASSGRSQVIADPQGNGSSAT
jgi:hypothetical protein